MSNRIRSSMADLIESIQRFQSSTVPTADLVTEHIHNVLHKERALHEEQYTGDFVAGWEAAKKSKNPQGAQASKLYRKVQSVHGITWVDGYKAFIDTKAGAYATPGAVRAKKLGLIA